MEDLQSILEKINREGVEKADAEAKRIIDDAKAKAAVLTRAGGVALLDIQTIDYSWGEIDLEYRPMNADLIATRAVGMAKAANSYDLDIQPDDIRVSDTVTVVWEIG